MAAAIHLIRVLSIPLLNDKDLSFAINCGAAHGALAMMNIGDNSMATAEEVFSRRCAAKARRLKDEQSGNLIKN